MCWLQHSAQLWSYPTFLLFPLAFIAAIECFAGYHAWRFLIGLNGGILGLAAGGMLGMVLGNSTLVLLGALVGAAAGGFLFAAIVPLGSFVFTLGSAASLAILLGEIIHIPLYWLMPAAIVGGLAAGIAALAACRPVMIAVAAVAGAQQMAGAWCAYHLPYDTTPLPDVIDPSELAAFLALTAAGLLIQFATSRVVPT